MTSPLPEDALHEAADEQSGCRAGHTWSPRGGVTIQGTSDPRYCARFAKDLEKPYLEALPFGHVFKRKVKGVGVRTVRLTDHGYQIDGKYFPTLYAAMMEIDGYPTIGKKTQGRMSARRFFGL